MLRADATHLTGRYESAYLGCAAALNEYGPGAGSIRSRADFGSPTWVCWHSRREAQGKFP